MFLSEEIRHWFFLVLRLLAAAGGFLAGYILSGPTASLLCRLAFHRPLPRWALFASKLTGGLLVALLIFWFLPLGSGGGGGIGSGGGTGKGIGPGTDNTGSGTSMQTGKGLGKDIAGASSKETKDKAILTVKLLGGDAVKDGNYYVIASEGTPIDGPALRMYLEKHHPEYSGIDIVVTEQSVGESHQAFRQLQKMADDFQMRSLIVRPK